MRSLRHFIARVRWSRRTRYSVIRQVGRLGHPAVVVCIALLALVYLLGHLDLL
jgi:hypothetical protein